MEDLIDWQRMRSLAPFAPEAFRFVQEGLQHTLERVRGAAPEGPAAGGGEAVVELDLELLGEIAGFDADDLERELEAVSETHSRHVSGQELCLGLRSLAVEKYGLLARTVLRGWGVSTTEDFGKIVYAMVDTGLLRTSDRDSLEDFRGVYEFDEAFDGPVDRCVDPAGGKGEVG